MGGLFNVDYNASVHVMAWIQTSEGGERGREGVKTGQRLTDYRQGKPPGPARMSGNYPFSSKQISGNSDVCTDSNQ